MTQAKFQAIAEYYKSLNIFDDTDDNASNKSPSPNSDSSSQNQSPKSSLLVQEPPAEQSVHLSVASKKSVKTSSADPFDGYFESLVGDKKKADCLKMVEPLDSGGKFDHLFPDGLDDLEGL